MNQKLNIEAWGYFLTQVGQPLERRDFSLSAPSAGEVVVKVAGCGLCHTDITFLTGQVKTKQQFPIILGHEISGEVIACGEGYENLKGKKVIIPAVLPCGSCELCEGDRDNICQQQKMPGNDFNGGFASHLCVPAKYLCVLPDDLKGFTLPQLSVIADAVTTPYQSLKRSQLQKNDLAIVIGVGGIGLYMVQHAKNAEAKVIALDVDDEKLAVAKEQGADYILNVKNMPENDIKGAIRGLVKENKLPRYRWKVYETSGTASGQQTAYLLLSYAGVIGFIGFTMDKLTVRLSNLMAFDADIFGNWGCRPVYYNDVVKDVLNQRIKLRENICEFPLDSINEVIRDAQEHKLTKRAIFKP